MKQLTRAEESVMQVLWKLEQALLMEIVDNMPEPKPHKNTVATILKILTDKEFVRVEVLGRIHEYHPLVTKEDYSAASLKGMAQGYFEGSYKNIVSFMVEDNKLSVEDLELLLNQLKGK